MNILLVHNTYQQPGGEDVVVAQERRLLEQHGHKVGVYERSNHEIDALSLAQRLNLISRIVSADDSKVAVRQLLRDLKPDLVHVHNTFAMVSPSVYEVCHEENVPVVQTLHNYRLLCPAATLYRDGRICEDCVTHSLLRSVRHACYHDSHAMTAAIALMLQTHRSRRTWDERISAYIAISNFARQKFIQAGMPAEKIFVKPNFIDPDPGVRSHSENFALFVGRLSPEKGLTTLMQAWQQLPANIPLKVVGDGPMRSALETECVRRGLAQVHFSGWLKREEVREALKKAAFLIVPSVWFEPFGLIVAEAYACGTPVLGARIGAIEEMLTDGVTGLHFPAGDSSALAEKVMWAWNHRSELDAMGRAGRSAYETHYTAETNYASLMEIYASTIEAHCGDKRDWPVRTAA